LEIEGRPKLAISPGTPKIDAGYFTTMGVLLLAEGQYRIGAQLPRLERLGSIAEVFLRPTLSTTIPFAGTVLEKRGLTSATLSRSTCSRMGAKLEIGSPHWTISATGSSAKPRKPAVFRQIRQGFAIAPPAEAIRSAGASAIS